MPSDLLPIKKKDNDEGDINPEHPHNKDQCQGRVAAHKVAMRDAP